MGFYDVIWGCSRFLQLIEGGDDRNDHKLISFCLSRDITQ